MSDHGRGGREPPFANGGAWRKKSMITDLDEKLRGQTRRRDKATANKQKDVGCRNCKKGRGLIWRVGKDRKERD